MAVTTLALVYQTNGRVTHSGLTGNAMPAVIAKTLSKLGILFEPGAYEGRVTNMAAFGVAKRAHIVTEFNREFGHPNNPNFTRTDSTTDVNEDPFAAADTTLTVDDNTQLAAYDYIQIDSEILHALVLDGGGADVTVARAQDGTVDAAHANNASVYIVATFTLTITAA